MKKKEKKIIFRILVIALIILVGYINGLNKTENTNNIENNVSNNFTNVENKNNDSKLEIHFIDVGQGDCILIKNNNEYALIDAGNNEYGDTVVEYLKKQNIQNLKYIFATHGDSDHIGGLDVVINKIDFDNIFYPKQVKTTQTFMEFAQAIKNKNKQIDQPIINDVMYLDKDAKITILSPEQKEYEDSNNYSIVLRLDYYNNSFIFMGDAEKDIENYLLNNKVDIKCDLIKLGHHGSNSSSTYNFIKEVNPKYAVITVGLNNEYNHPSPKVISRLNNMNIQVYRTDQNGNIIVQSDGTNINIKKER